MDIQGAAAAAGVIAAFVVGIAAVIVANRANDIAEKAVEVAASARDLSEQAIQQSKRDAILGSVPHLVGHQPSFGAAGKARLPITNGGQVVAYGVLGSIAFAPDRKLEAADESTRKWSGRQPALAPGEQRNLTIMFDPPAGGWHHVRLEYVSPLGARVTHDYIGPGRGAERDRRFRLHLVTIDPRDGTEPVRFPIELGPFDDEPDVAPLYVGVAQ
ncbi:MAG TPA: hypothetical protein VJ850_09720 [Candidatus Limnocylindrales bacterium]|nr:hypothetical protein [Candidatus Limnocylindrales bacterium]